MTATTPYRPSDARGSPAASAARVAARSSKLASASTTWRASVGDMSSFVFRRVPFVWLRAKREKAQVRLLFRFSAFFFLGSMRRRRYFFYFPFVCFCERHSFFLSFCVFFFFSTKMLVLFETSAGFALFKLLKDGRLDKPEVRAHAENEACRPGLFFFTAKRWRSPLAASASFGGFSCSLLSTRDPRMVVGDFLCGGKDRCGGLSGSASGRICVSWQSSKSSRRRTNALFVFSLTLFSLPPFQRIFLQTNRTSTRTLSPSMPRKR